MAFWNKKSRSYSKDEPQNKNPSNNVAFGGISCKESWTNRENYRDVVKRLYTDCPISRRCIDIRADKIRSVSIMVEKGNAFSRRLIERPNFRDRTFTQLLSVVETELLVGGDAYLFLNTTPGRTPTLEVLRQDFVVQKPNEYRVEYDPSAVESGPSNPELVFDMDPAAPDFVLQAWQRVDEQLGNGTFRSRLERIDGHLLHIMHHNPLSSSSGSGSGDSVLKQVDTWLVSDKLINRRFKAGGRNQGYQTLPLAVEELSDEEFNQLKSRLEQIGELNEIQFVADGTDFISTQMSFKDLDVVQIRNQLERNIASGFGVPAVMLNMEGEASYANQRGVDRIFYTGLLKPRMDWLLSQIQSFLRDNSQDTRLVLAIDESKIEYLKTDKMEVAKAASQMKIATVNELRAMIGLEPVEGGDAMPADASSDQGDEEAPADDEQPDPSQQREVSHNADTSRRNGRR